LIPIFVIGQNRNPELPCRSHGGATEQRAFYSKQLETFFGREQPAAKKVNRNNS